MERITSKHEGSKQGAIDYNKLSELLREGDREHYAFQLPEERQYHVVVRRLTDEKSQKSVWDELHEQGFEDIEVIQLTSRRTKLLLNLFLVKTKNPKIYDVKTIRGLKVKMQP